MSLRQIFPNGFDRDLTDKISLRESSDSILTSIDMSCVPLVFRPGYRTPTFEPPFIYPDGRPLPPFSAASKRTNSSNANPSPHQLVITSSPPSDHHRCTSNHLNVDKLLNDKSLMPNHGAKQSQGPDWFSRASFSWRVTLNLYPHDSSAWPSRHSGCWLWCASMLCDWKGWICKACWLHH